MKNNNKLKIILGIIIIAVIIIFILIFLINKENKNNISENSNQISEQQVKTEEDEKLITELKEKTEAERMKTYLGKYFKYIESKDYNSAYDLLYPQFKQNYFPTVEDYEKYIKEQDFPELMTIDYNEISMQGELYIVTVKIGNMTARSETQKVEKTFIIKENGYNDYYISLKK